MQIDFKLPHYLHKTIHIIKSCLLILSSVIFLFYFFKIFMFIIIVMIIFLNMITELWGLLLTVIEHFPVLMERV